MKWSIGHVTDDVTHLERSRSWPRYKKCPLSRHSESVTVEHLGNQKVTWQETSLDPNRSRSWHQYVGHIMLNMTGDTRWVTSRSSRYIRVEVCYKVYKWHWTDSVFDGTLSCLFCIRPVLRVRSLDPKAVCHRPPPKISHQVYYAPGAILVVMGTKFETKSAISRFVY